MLRFADFRLDASTLKRLPDGSIKVQGQLTHPGVFSYRNPDGTERKEYRPADEVFKKAALDTFAGAPITINHPRTADGQRLVTAQSWKDVAIGHLGENVREDAGHVVADLYVRDASAVARIDNGDLRHISCGYEVDFDSTPGVTTEGQRYDGVQRNIRSNHVALLPNGVAPRGGDQCVLRLDSNGDELISLNYPHMDLEALKAQITALTAELNKARTDAADVEKLKAELATAQAKVAELTALVSPERLDSLVDERAAVVALGKSAGVETADKSALAIKRAVVAKRTPDLAARVDSLNVEAVDAILAVYKAEPVKSMDVLGLQGEATRTDKQEVPATDKIPTVSEMYEKSLKGNRDAWANSKGDGATR